MKVFAFAICAALAGAVAGFFGAERSAWGGVFVVLALRFLGLVYYQVELLFTKEELKTCLEKSFADFLAEKAEEGPWTYEHPSGKIWLISIVEPRRSDETYH